MSKIAAPEYLLGRIETLKNVLFISKGRRSMSVKPGILENMRKKGKQIQGPNNELLQLLKAAKRNVENDLKRQKKPIGKVVTPCNFAKSFTNVFKTDKFKWSESIDGRLVQFEDSNHRLGMFVVQILDGMDIGLREMTDQERQKYIYLIQKRLEDKKLNVYPGKDDTIVKKGLMMAQFTLENINNLDKVLMDEPSFPQKIGSIPYAVNLKLPTPTTHLLETLRRPMRVVKEYIVHKKEQSLLNREKANLPSYIGSGSYAVRVKLSTPMSHLLGTFSCPMRVAKGFVEKLRGKSKETSQNLNEDFEIGDPRQVKAILDQFPVSEDVLDTPKDPFATPSGKETIEELKNRLIALYQENSKEIETLDQQIALKNTLRNDPKTELRNRIAKSYHENQQGNRIPTAEKTPLGVSSVAIVPVKTANLKIVPYNPYLGQPIKKGNEDNVQPTREDIPDGLNPIIPERLPDLDTPEPSPVVNSGNLSGLPEDYDSDAAWEQMAYMNQQNGKKM